MRYLFIILILFYSCSKGQPIKVIASSRTQSPPSVPNTSIINLFTDSILSVGNSITLGLNGPPGTGTDWTTYDSSWVNRLQDSTGKLIDNEGESGTGLWYSLQELVLYPIHGTGRNAITFAAGYNDVRFVGGDSALMRRFREVVRHSVGLQFLKLSTLFYSSQCSVNNEGQWLATVTPTYTHTYNLGGTTRRRTGGTDTSTWIKYDFTGGNFIVAFNVTDSINPDYQWTDTYWVEVDGVVVDSINTFNYASGNIPRWGWEVTPPTHCYIRTGLGAGSHSVKLKFVRNNHPTGAGSGNFIDYFATLETDTSQIRPFIIMEVQKQTAAGYVVDPAFDQGSDAAVEACNNNLRYMVDYFKGIGYTGKITIAPVNSYYIPASDEDTDLIHPKPTTGHRHWWQALKSVINY